VYCKSTKHNKWCLHLVLNTVRSTVTLTSMKASSKAWLAAQRVYISECVMDKFVVLMKHGCCWRSWSWKERGDPSFIFHEGLFCGGLECQGGDVAFHCLFDVEGQCRDSTLFYKLWFFCVFF